jgi:septum formation protein
LNLPETLLPVPGEVKVILSSASPRRRELMGLVVPEFEVVVPGCESAPKEGEPPERYAIHMASKKCHQVFSLHPKSVVVGADTVVVIDGEILGKPHKKEDAARMLRMLSGREHRVITGVSVCWPQGEESFFQESVVRFGALEETEIERYIATGEPMDKAGAYGIQGFGACLVEEVRGSYTNVVGLPVRRLYLCLKEVFNNWDTT